MTDHAPAVRDRAVAIAAAEGLNAARDATGIARTTIKMWCDVDGVTPSRLRRSWTPSERAAAVEHARVEGVHAAAQALGCHLRCLRKWCQTAGVTPAGATAHSTPARMISTEQLVADNLGLVGFTITKYYRHHIGTESQGDLYQDGVLGLMRAAEKFDPDRGVRFSTYAVVWIRGFIQQGFHKREGKNFRYALDKGIPYTRPASLNIDVSDGEMSLEMGDFIADDHPGVDETVASDCMAATIIDLLYQYCHDDVDRAVADAIVANAHGARVTIADVHARIGRGSRSRIGHRRRTLLERVAHHLESHGLTAPDSLGRTA